MMIIEVKNIFSKKRRDAKQFFRQFVLIVFGPPMIYSIVLTHIRLKPITSSLLFSHIWLLVHVKVY